MRLQQWMQLTLLCFASPRVSSYQLRPPSEPLTRRSVGARIAAAAPAVAAAFLGAPRAARALDENKIDAQLKATANAGGGAADGGGAAPPLSSRESIPVPSISDAPPYSKLVPLVELEAAVAQWEVRKHQAQGGLAPSPAALPLVWNRRPRCGRPSRVSLCLRTHDDTM